MDQEKTKKGYIHGRYNSIPRRKKQKLKENLCRYCAQNLASYNIKNNKVYSNSLPEWRGSRLVKTIEGANDEIPTFKLTNFAMHCKSGHLCALDSEMLEKGKLYFTGFIKPILEEIETNANIIAIYSDEEIKEWWISGFDGGHKALIGISTKHAEYYLAEPTTEYEGLLQGIHEKSLVSKIIIEYLLDFGDLDPTYEDLCSFIENRNNIVDNSKKICINDVFKHSHFICCQICDIDLNEQNEVTLSDIRCVRTLANLNGIDLSILNNPVKSHQSLEQTRRMKKAYTTSLVNKVFENFFKGVLDDARTAEEVISCGICDNCKDPYCGKCKSCKSLTRFGGQRKSIISCPNMSCARNNTNSTQTSESVHESAIENFNSHTDEVASISKIYHSIWYTTKNPSVKWTSDSTTIDDTKFYQSAQVDDEMFQIGDCILLQPKNNRMKSLIASIIYFCEIGFVKRFHCRFFNRNCDTILREAGNPKELFVTDSCLTLEFGLILRKEHVKFNDVSNNWRQNSEFVMSENISESFYYNKKYIAKNGSFVSVKDINISTTKNYYLCPICESVTSKNQNPCLLGENSLSWRNETYSIGDFILVNSDDISQCSKRLCSEEIERHRNPDLYTEFFRKNDNTYRNKILPMQIGYIKSIYHQQSTNRNKEIMVKLYKIFRPEEIPDLDYFEMDFNIVFWSYRELEVTATSILKKCYVSHISNLMPRTPSRWSNSGPLRFYFSKILDKESWQLRQADNFSVQIKSPEAPQYPKLTERLKTLDVFSGAGGLSQGLYASGLAELNWAIEIDESAAYAIQENHPNAKVIQADSNTVLKGILEHGDPLNRCKLPQKGDVDLLVAGPPCQGFSTMNRFSKNDASRLSNSLIANCLSFVDYYRPRFFIMENVRAFVSYKKGALLKLTLACLLSTGYQCSFAILQAGHYGLPQTRRRLFIFAAAPDEQLPNFPDPKHSFSLKASSLYVTVDGKCYFYDKLTKQSAPYRMVTVEDAINDLPAIEDTNEDPPKLPYKTKARSNYQRIVRPEDLASEYPLDHECRSQGALNKMRISQIPHYDDSDWRDLPNIPAICQDGKKLKVLEYDYMIETGKGPKLRGVCACNIGLKCRPEDRQENTLIPWCLPHTAKRNNNWAGLYGRLSWNGIFSTTVTSPEPIGKQGRVLHPSENRIISVRECARSQGFPDNYTFYGTLSDKHRQVGNAVPPILAAEIGNEFIKILK